MEGEIKNLIKVWLMVLASLLYCRFISTKLSKGKLRLFSLLPIFSLFTILPLQLSSVMPTGITAMSITWLCNFKLLLFAFDQGPLIPSNDKDPPLPLLQFIAIACLPVKIRQNQKHPSHQNHKLPINWPAKVVLFAVLIGMLNAYVTQLHPKLVLIVYCVVLYFLVDVIFGVCNGLMMLLGMELEPPSDEPYCSTSLQDFWGRRWNLVVTNTLRRTVYKPVRVFSEYWVGKQWAPLPAVLASFLVSGLMHELIFYHIIRAAPTWEVTWYFVLHGLCLVVEFGVKKLVAGRWRLHWAVSGPLTVGFVAVTAAWLFFPPMTRTGADVRAIEETKMLFNFVKERLQV
ncbi:long-chain-alcohol O-fatty-acyltransferase 3 [Tripterygium wilfordii]|uniref:Long-chain-alcohol O-fatty-acyltransferase 3 n=1 Tax=Tripterygium wilfordii TaxID=458696 RepID=A0A7J7C1E9_TRIWF|nr:probable long-chain-alcohol O-fatty-acyltransferase 5 [Tripterygium wilfordii]KAF5727928.1 long-chain-alcohol O-fatty-acyltransferase 3 [Tripterygium wilfordii]